MYPSCSSAAMEQLEQPQIEQGAVSTAVVVPFARAEVREEARVDGRVELWVEPNAFQHLAVEPMDQGLAWQT